MKLLNSGQFRPYHFFGTGYFSGEYNGHSFYFTNILAITEFPMYEITTEVNGGSCS